MVTKAQLFSLSSYYALMKTFLKLENILNVVFHFCCISPVGTCKSYILDL